VCTAHRFDALAQPLERHAGEPYFIEHRD
jgi:hypothetical protein